MNTFIKDNLPAICTLLVALGALQAQVSNNSSVLDSYAIAIERGIRTAHEVDTLRIDMSELSSTQREKDNQFMARFDTFLGQQGEILSELKVQRSDINNVKEDIKELKSK